MSENSVDYIARFNDLAQELSVSSLPPPWVWSEIWGKGGVSYITTALWKNSGLLVRKSKCIYAIHLVGSAIKTAMIFDHQDQVCVWVRVPAHHFMVCNSWATLGPLFKQICLLSNLMYRNLPYQDKYCPGTVVHFLLSRPALFYVQAKAATRLFCLSDVVSLLIL